MATKISAFFLSICISASAVFGLTHSRSYQWSFKYGNSIPNWSFENSLDFWLEDPAYGISAQSRFKASGVVSGGAKTGSFVAKVSGTYSGGSVYQPLYSDVLSLMPDRAYTLSFYYQTTGTFSGSIRPRIKCFATKDQSAQLWESAGSNLASNSTWTLYVMSFATPGDIQYGQIVLPEFNGNGQATLFFDNVVLEEGSFSFSEVQAHRLDFSEGASFGDGFGRTIQSHVKATRAGDVFAISGLGYDNFARPETTYLPTSLVQSSPTYQTSLSQYADLFYNATGPFNARGFPFSRVKYADEPGGRVIESTSPDSAWQFGKGHTVKQDFYFVIDTLVPANIENPTINSVECKYRLDWVKDQDSSYTLTWTNRLGQIARKANNVTRGSGSANTWKWAATRYQYYPSGKIKKVLTPIDDSAGTTAFAEISQFNALGQQISAYSPDRNLRKFWYNRGGQLRYSQDEEQRASGEYSYYEYDNQGRILSQGIHVVWSVPQDSVDKDSYNQGSKIEQIGFIYDDSSTFQARTGFTLQEILGGFQSYVSYPNAPNRLFCKYNRNQDSQTPKFTAKEKFVADFYSYNDRGLLEWQWKYLGAIKDSFKRLQDVQYLYDAQARMTNFMNYNSAYEGLIDNSENYSFDFNGRVDTLRGNLGRFLARYNYASWGPLTKVTLGGLASGDSSANVEFSFHSQGWVREAKATGKYGASTPSIFQQLLGFEGKAYPSTGVPDLIGPRFDGTITQQVYKYTSDLDGVKPVRAVNYNYDGLGRMGTAKAYWNTNAGPLNGSQDVNWASLTMDTAGTLSSWLNYDLNGRISGQRSAGVGATDSAQYRYLLDSYRLDYVTGKLSQESTRNLSAAGTFVYDANGALLRDKSKKLNAVYGGDGWPVSITLDSISPLGTLRCCLYDANQMPMHFRVRYPSFASHNLYDADGNKVSRIEIESKPTLKTKSTHHVQMGPGLVKVWTEEYHLSGRIKKTSTTVSLHGVGSQIGRIRPDGKYEFFIKNHLGSTVLTVDDRGRYDYGSARAYDYLAFGSSKLLKVGSDTVDVTQKFTGKEFDKLTGLYDFGARLYDPELGVWTSTDPASEYSNPYSYAGGNPVNRIDPNGMDSEPVGDTLDLPPLSTEGKKSGGEDPGGPQGYPMKDEWDIGGFKKDAREREESRKRMAEYNHEIWLTKAARLAQDQQFATISSPGFTSGPYYGPSISELNEFNPADYDGLSLNEIEASGLTQDQREAVYLYTINNHVMDGIMTGDGFHAASQRISNPVLATGVAWGGVALSGGRSLKGVAKSGISRAERLLRPGGKLIGEAGTSRSIRMVPGGRPAAQKMFSRLSGGGVVSSRQFPNLTIANLSEGGIVTFRSFSRSAGNSHVTIDINIQGLGIKEIKFY